MLKKTNKAAVVAADGRTTSYSKVGSLMQALGVYAIAVLFIALGALLQATGVIRGFLTLQKALNIFDAVSLLGIIAVGMTFVTYSGHFADMSVPTTMALSGIVCVDMLKFGFIPGILSAFAVGLIVGVINALAIGKLKTNPVIWTLAMNYVSLGVIRVVWVNKQIYPDFTANSELTSHLFDQIYRLRFFNKISLPMILMVVLAVVFSFVLSKTKFGLQLKMTGSARNAAKYSGVNVEKVIGIGFIICSLTAALGGLVITSLSRVGAYYNGEGYDFKAVTAVVIGGMTLAGGRGTIAGVIGGVFIIGIMNNIMTLLGIGTFSQDMVRGVIFIIVVVVNAVSLRSTGRDDA